MEELYVESPVRLYGVVIKFIKHKEIHPFLPCADVGNTFHRHQSALADGPVLNVSGIRMHRDPLQFRFPSRTSHTAA
jgi:hypothetical protein